MTKSIMHLILRLPALSVPRLLAALFLASVPPLHAALMAGAAAVDVTPQTLPIRVAGSIGERYVDVVTDPLHARALVLEQGETRLAICIVDNCVLPREMLDAAKEAAAQSTGIPVDQMLIAATHTHSAPVVMGAHGNDPVEDYRDWLQGRITEALVRAWNNRVPARVGYGAGHCLEWVHCRRWIMKPGTALTVPFTGHASNDAQMNPGHDNPNKLYQTGPVDTQVTVLSVQTRQGQPLALLANYSTHYAGAPGISADYFGEFARLVEKELAPANTTTPFVGIMCNGTSGDANCIDFRKPARPFDHKRVAQDVVKVALDAIRDIAYAEEIPLGMKEALLTLKVRMPDATETTAARSWLKEHLPDGKVTSWEENYARETYLLSGMAPTRELKLQAVRIGNFAMTAIPCEVYGSTGLNLKSGSPFPLTMNIGLANGYSGYLPPPNQHPLGGYTTWRARSSCLEVDAEPKITRTLFSLLRDLHGK